MSVKDRNSHAGSGDFKVGARKNSFGFENHFVFFERVTVLAESVYMRNTVGKNRIGEFFGTFPRNAVFQIVKPRNSRARYRLIGGINYAFNLKLVVERF